MGISLLQPGALHDFSRWCIPTALPYLPAGFSATMAITLITGSSPVSGMIKIFYSLVRNCCWLLEDTSNILLFFFLASWAIQIKQKAKVLKSVWNQDPVACTFPSYLSPSPFPSLPLFTPFPFFFLFPSFVFVCLSVSPFGAKDQTQGIIHLVCHSAWHSLQLALEIC